MREENSGEEGLLSDVIEGEGDKQKITAKAVKARLKEIGKDPVYSDEREVLVAYSDLLEQQTEAKASARPRKRTWPRRSTPSTANASLR